MEGWKRLGEVGRSAGLGEVGRGYRVSGVSEFQSFREKVSGGGRFCVQG